LSIQERRGEADRGWFDDEAGAVDAAEMLVQGGAIDVRVERVTTVCVGRVTVEEVDEIASTDVE
jgi:hypothetical protein